MLLYSLFVLSAPGSALLLLQVLCKGVENRKQLAPAAANQIHTCIYIFCFLKLGIEVYKQNTS